MNLVISFKYLELQSYALFNLVSDKTVLMFFRYFNVHGMVHYL